MIDKRLYKAGIIAIPLLPQPNAQVGLVMPTHLVVEKQLSFAKSEIINPLTLNVEVLDVVNIRYKLGRRTILPNNQFDEKILIQEETIQIPVDFLPMIVSYSALKKNLNFVNQGLLQFKFSDCLQFFKCELDESKLDEIIAQESLDDVEIITDEVIYEL